MIQATNASWARLQLLFKCKTQMLMEYCFIRIVQISKMSARQSSSLQVILCFTFLDIYHDDLNFWNIILYYIELVHSVKNGQNDITMTICCRSIGIFHTYWLDVHTLDTNVLTKNISKHDTRYLLGYQSSIQFPEICKSSESICLLEYVTNINAMHQRLVSRIDSWLGIKFRSIKSKISIDP